MDTKFIEEYKARAKEASVPSEDLMFLAELAKYAGNYLWSYKGEDKLHQGPVAQDLERIEGLKEAVKVDPVTGIKELDTRLLASAAIAAVGALARAISGIEYEPPMEEE